MLPPDHEVKRDLDALVSQRAQQPVELVACDVVRLDSRDEKEASAIHYTAPRDRPTSAGSVRRTRRRSPPSDQPVT